jgi:hypothetical protein
MNKDNLKHEKQCAIHDVSGLLLTRTEMLEIARTKINSHFLTDYKTHDEIMADKRTGSAMIGFMKCWEWLKQ